MSKPLILVDGSSYLYRAFHALPALTNKHGEPTGAIYGVVNMLRKLIKEEAPNHIAIVFDSKGKTFRHELFPEYKAQRPPMPETLVPQIEPLHAIIRAMGLPLIVMEGIEADDIIGVLTHKGLEAGLKVMISTGDKDMAQLVTNDVTLTNTMTGVTMGPEGVFEKFGVRPDQIVDYLTLIGDTSDNIPGVPKVGPKTAAKWLAEYGTLDNLVVHANEIKGKVGEYLRDSLSILPLSKELVTLRCDLHIPIEIDDLKCSHPDSEALKKAFERFQFKSWLAELGGGQPDVPRITYQCVTTESALKQWAADIKKSGMMCLEVKGDSLNAREAYAVGIALSQKAGDACYIPFGHVEGEQLPAATVWQYLKPLLEDATIEKIGHHLKYAQIVLWNSQINLQGLRFDTLLESYMYSSIGSTHELNVLAAEYCNHTMHISDMGRGKDTKTFNELDLTTATGYAAENADFILRVHHVLWPLLQEKEKPAALLQALEMPLLTVLAKMEYLGVGVDETLLKAQSEVFEQRLEGLKAEIFKASGEEFNIDSPKQLQWILFDKMGYPTIEKTPTGQPSTGESVLQALAVMYPLPALILEYRSVSKLKSTYTDKLPQMINASTGRVHTSYHQAVTATGRLSSSDPNLQNIPIRTQAGRDIRKAFIAPPGKVIVAIDYSQIELRIMAHLSEDPALIKAFHNKVDIHTATAAEVFDMKLDEVTHEARRRAKAINFGLIYGMSAFGLAKQLGTSREEAQKYVDIYFARYPGVKAYMDRMRAFASAHGYVETIWGRRLDLPDINAGNFSVRMAAERTAINAPMQGTAADIIKRAMITIDDWITTSKVDARMVMQVHDELVFEVGGDVDHIAKKLVHDMETAMTLSVPLEAHMGIGLNWDEAH
ncbi:MAG: DNA polymerase I [Gammaproteobacteria bacterium]